MCRFAPLLFWTAAIVALSVGGVAAAGERGAWYEGFEGPNPTWLPAGASARYRVEAHQRVQGEAHTGQGSEYFRISGSGAGSEVYVAHDVGRPRIIDELLPTVWVKSDRPGMQIAADVVLPRTLDPRTGRPLSAMLHGSSYTMAGRWQQLRLDDIPRLLDRQTEVLRAQYGPQVDAREAYIGRVLLNIYGGPGVTNVWIDDLDIAGYVGLPSGAGTRPVPAGPDTAALATPSGPVGRLPDGAAGGRTLGGRIKLDGPVLLVDGRPMSPRIIQYQGEPFALLKQLGFNTIWLAQLPTVEMLEEANRLGLWLVCPPPFAVQPERRDVVTPLPEIGPGYDRVLAWDLGAGLGRDELAITKLWAEQIRSADRRQSGRPLVCRPASELAVYSRDRADLLVMGCSPLGTSLELSAFGTWVRERPRLARPGTPFWTAIQTQPTVQMVGQWAILAGGGRVPQTFAEEQIRLLVYTAITAGSRALLFESRSPLDAPDPDSHARAMTLELLNLELDLIEPWAAAGKLAVTVAGNISGYDHSGTGQLFGEKTSSTKPGGGNADAQRGTARAAKIATIPGERLPGSEAEIIAALLQVEHGQLLLPIWSAAHGQCVAGQSAGTGISFVVPGVSEVNDAYLLMPGALRILRHPERVTGGVKVVLDEFGLTAAVVLTQEPLVVTSLTRRAAQSGRRAAELRTQLAAIKLQTVQDVHARISGRAPGPAQTSHWIADAQVSLQRAGQLLAGGDHAGAYLDAERAMRPLRLLERSDWETAIRGLREPISSPAAVNYAMLPYHWMLLEKIAAAQPAGNRLPAGDFEDLDTMLQAGWQLFRLQHPTDGLLAEAQLRPSAKHAGRLGLRLVVRPALPSQSPGLVESSPIWITTPPVAVEAGELLSIQGWVNVPAPITGSVDGLLIRDSLGGESLEARITQTKGWEPFTLYRVATQSGPITVTFALSGIGDAWLDDVAIVPLRPGAARPPRR